VAAGVRGAPARAGAGPVGLVSGAPGIGTWRRLQAVRARVAAKPPLRRSEQGAPSHAHRAFALVMAPLERAAHVEPGAPPARERRAAMTRC
jgi:hypothetical protein